jgi:cytochrome c-type biogenesis protein CcmH/NrfG
MKKVILSFISSLSICAVVTAQDVNAGIKFLYYERLTSAKQVLQKLVASNPKDPQAVYWLGQAYIMDGHLDSAKALYQSTISGGVNDPLLWVGSGEVDVLQGGDINAAKQKFEQAITSTTATKGKNKGQPDPNILNAIGRAMAAGSSTQGDPNYGIDKLKQAAQIDPKNPDIFINLGLCYRKLGGDQGGQAFQAFQQATIINPQYAKAFYLIGRIYQSQRNKESMDEWYGKAIAADPTFAPVYAAYFNYYSEKDVNAAKEFLDKFVANADQDCNTQYFVGNYLFRAGKYQESLQQAKNMETNGCGSYSRINVLYAYNYDRLGDSVQARSYIQKYFAAADTSEIQPSDYAFAGGVLGKFSDTGDSSAHYYLLAISKDTVPENKKAYMDSAVKIAVAAKNYGLLTQIVTAGGKLSETEYYSISKTIADAAQADTTKTAFDSAKYLAGANIIQQYINAFPDKPQPYAFYVRYAKAADKDTSRGLALAPIQTQNTFEKTDTASSAKAVIFRNDAYLLIYYANNAPGDKAENYKKAISIADEMMALFPDPGSEENKYAAAIKGQLQKALTPKSTPSTPSKSKSSGKNQK